MNSKKEIMDEQVFHLITEKFEEVRTDLHEIRDSFRSHEKEDQTYWREIWFIKRVLVAIWAVLVVGAGFIGWKITP